MAARIAVALLALAASFALPAHAAVIYEWVDEHGRVQMSDVVPKKYKRTARRLDSRQFDVPPQQLKAAQAEAAALKAKAKAVPPQPQPRPSRIATPAPAPAAIAPAAPPSPDFADCASWRRAFVESRDCYVGYHTVRGIRPGAYQACGPAIPDPEPKCGPEE
jgi:hypothetical protein